MSQASDDQVDVSDDDDLYGRIAPDHVNSDGTVNSAAFKRAGKPDPSISVNLARLTTPCLTLAPRPEFGLGVLKAKSPRSEGLTVSHSPELEPPNPAHCLIEGATTRRICQSLARATVLAIPPDPDRFLGAGWA